MTKIFLDAYAVKLSDCTDVIDYTRHYQIAFDKLFSLHNNKSYISKKTIKIILQGSLLRYLGREYTTFITTIETN